MARASNDNHPKGQLAATDPARTGTCPICREASLQAYRPFCSKKCADIDLGRWLNGTYVVAADPGGEEEDSLPIELHSSSQEEV